MATREDCIRALENAADRIGESPTKAQYEQLDLTPSASTILRHFDGWNAAKSTAGLETNPSTGTRVAPQPDDVSLPDGVEWASLSQDQRWHYRNRDQNARQSRDRRRGLRQWLHEYRGKEGGCTQCGEPGPACLDFHHIDDDEKQSTVNQMVASGYSKEAIRAEIDRCDLLCANCHWREHHEEPSAFSSIDTTLLKDGPSASLASILLEEKPAQYSKEDWIRAWTYAYQQVEGCQRCKESDPVCLQFHHDAEKTMGVGAMIAQSRPVEEILTEIRKTTVLCANCHRKEHHEARWCLSD